MKDNKISMPTYWLTRFLSKTVSKFFFKNKILRNELKGATSPYIVIANHQAALDFVNLISATKSYMSFVISHAFYSTLPLKRSMQKIGVIPKQQFSTTISDLNKMKSMIKNGKNLAIYPAGLMSENGLGTPIPDATYKFLKWIDADVYVARSYGTYMVTPKWSKIKRPGRTYLDIYKLFDKKELEEMDEEQIREKTLSALLFDAYKEQERFMVKYRHGNNVEGLENILYRCPVCNKKYTISSKKNTLSCSECGYTVYADKYSFLHKSSDIGRDIRYISDWSNEIYQKVTNEVNSDNEKKICFCASISKIKTKRKFTEVGRANITINHHDFTIIGNIEGEEKCITVPICNFASLPFKPGECFDIQLGDEILRCTPDDKRTVMEITHYVRAFYEINCKKKHLMQHSADVCGHCTKCKE